MFLDGARTNFKDHANFAVSFALNHPRQHFRLAFAQTKSFGTGIESVVEFHNLFLQLRVMVACAGRTCRIFWIAGLHLCLFSNPLLFCATAAEVELSVSHPVWIVVLNATRGLLDLSAIPRPIR